MVEEIRSRASTVIFKDGQILAFRAEDPFDHSPYVFLPGGKIESGESPEAAAARETFEETGYKVVLEPERRSFARYKFRWNGQPVLCETWFLAGGLKTAEEVPQLVVDASYHRGVVWVPVAEIETQFGYHPTILQAIKSALPLAPLFSPRVIYADAKYLPSFYATLDEVAREEVYIELIAAPSWQEVELFLKDQIEHNLPCYYALSEERVVGWADISVSENPRLKHRGFLGMGVVKSHRRLGLGKKLLEACLKHAREQGLEKVELTVSSENQSAIALYEKLGFKKVGHNRHYRKMGSRYFDALWMEVDLTS